MSVYFHKILKNSAKGEAIKKFFELMHSAYGSPMKLFLIRIKTQSEDNSVFHSLTITRNLLLIKTNVLRKLK